MIHSSSHTYSRVRRGECGSTNRNARASADLFAPLDRNAEARARAKRRLFSLRMGHKMFRRMIE